MKRLILFCCILFVALFALQWGISHPSLLNRAKQQIENQMSQLWGREVRIGRMQPRLLPPSLILSDITSGAPPDALRIREIQVVFNLWPTWPLRVKRIVVDSPSVALTEQTLHALLEKKTAASALRVHAIQIKNGALDYQATGVRPLRGESIRLTGIQGTLYPGTEPHPARVDLTAAQGEITTPTGGAAAAQAKYRIDHLKGEALFQPDQLRIQNVTLVSGRSTLRAEGTFHSKEKRWDLALNGQIPLESLLRRGSLTPATPNGWNPSGGWHPSGILTILGRLNWTQGPPPNVTFEGDVAVPHFSLDHRDVGALHAHLAYRNGEVIVSSASGTLFSGTVTGEARWVGQTDSETPALLQMRLHYKRLPLAETLRFVFRENKRIAPAGILLDGNVALQIGKAGPVAEGNIRGYRETALMGVRSIPPSAGAAGVAALATEGSASWKWLDNSVTFTQGTLSFPGARALLSGAWDKGSGLRVETELRAVEMAPLAEALNIPATGALNLKGRFSVGPIAKYFEGDVSLNDWTLKHRAFKSAAASVRYQDGLFSFREGSIQAAAARTPTYQFEGGVHFDPSGMTAFEFQTRVAAADPQDILTLFNLSVPLQTTATGPLFIQGTPHAFSVSGPLTLGAGRLYGEPFQKGRLALTVTQEAVTLKEVVLESAATSGTRLQGAGEIQYRGDYQIDAHVTHVEKSDYWTSKLSGLLGDTALTVKGAGTLKHPILKVTATSNALQYDKIQMGGGSLSADVMGNEVHFDGHLQDGRTAGQERSITGTVRLSEPYPFSFQSHFSDLPLDPWLSSSLSRSGTSVTLAGAISGRGTIRQWDQADLTISLTDVSAEIEGIALHNDGPILVHADRGVYTIERARFTGENTGLTFQGGVTPLKNWDLYVQGEADLNLLPLFVPQITSGRGTARLDLRVLDAWKTPRIQGNVSLAQGLLRTPLFPQSIYIASMSAIFNERVLVLEELRGRMGGGPFHAEGNVDLVGWGLSKFGLQIRLRDMEIPLHPDLSAVASGDLLIEGDRRQQQVTGEITLRNAVYSKRVELKSFIANLLSREAVSPLSDTEAPDAVALNILLHGTEALRIDNNIANVPLELDLSVKGTLRRPLLVGRVVLPEGHLYFQNNDFRVTTGSVEFLTLDRIDPTFNIKAETKTRNAVDDQEYAIDLTLSGTLSQFTLDLIASPPLPEKDVLALLSGEATAFVVSEIFEGPIQKITGIDRVRIAPDSTQSGSARIIAEKRLLKDRLSVTYATPLDASKAPQIRMIYELSPHLSLIGEQDEKGRKGGDIRFRFDFR